MSYEGNCRLGELFSSRREKGRAGLPTMSVTLNDGLVNREDLDRKQDTNLAPEQHLLVKPGDIAYNMMRMWQGACGLAAQEGMVSPAYVVLKPNLGIDQLYATYLFNTARMRYLLWAYSYGLTDDRLRLYYPDFARIPVSVPSTANQKAIAEILSIWDHAILVSEQLVARSREEKRALVRALVDWQGIASRPIPTISVRLGALGSVIRGVTFQPSELTSPDAIDAIPLLRAHNIYQRATNDEDLIFVKRSVISERQTLRKGDMLVCMSSGSKTLVGKSGRFSLHGRSYTFGAFCAAFRPNDDCESNLVLHLMQGRAYRHAVHIQLAGSSINNLRPSDIESIKVEIPSSREDQKRVALALDTLDQITAARVNDLKLLRIQRTAIVGKLFPSTKRSL